MTKNAIVTFPGTNDLDSELEAGLTQGLHEALATGMARAERLSGADHARDVVRSATEKAISVLEQRRDERIDSLRAALQLENTQRQDEINMLDAHRKAALATAEQLSLQATDARTHMIKVADDGAMAIKAELETFNNLISMQRELLGKL